MRLSKNFHSSEFICPCCGVSEMNDDFISLLQRIREIMGRPMYVSSGYRCASYNKQINGSPRSMHMQGRAADIAVPDNIYRRLLAETCFKEGVPTVGFYRGHIHIDDRRRSNNIIFVL